MISELRLVDLGGGSLQLQSRSATPVVDASGAFCGTQLGAWTAVPVIHGEQHAVSVVDVFDTRKEKTT